MNLSTELSKSRLATVAKSGGSCRSSSRKKEIMSYCLKKGFTLIEALVIIAIIAILAAIIFLVFAQAPEKARTTAYLSNMRQIGTGLCMYVEDYD